MSDCFVLYLLLTCMKKKTSGADKFTNNNYGTFDFSEYQNVKSTNKLAIIHDNDEKQGEYEMEIENTDKVETGIWKWNDDGYITLYQDDKAVANLVCMNGKYLFFDADVEIQKLKRISETAIVR